MHVAEFWLPLETTQMSALLCGRALGMLSINLLIQRKAEDLGRKGSCQTSFFILFPVPSVSLCILWPQIINILCYPGRNNKIQRHDSRLIKIWRGTKISQSLYEMLFSEQQKLWPKSHTCACLSFLFLLAMKTLEYVMALLWRMPLYCWLASFTLLPPL